MDFGILGPLEVWDRGRLVELRRRKQRALLAMLLLRPGEVLSSDALVEGLWGERAPRTAVSALRNYVSQLRRHLGSGVIVAAAGGYLLDAQARQIDLGRFELLVAEGRRATGESRVEKLRAGLAEWRGPPLADLAFEPFAELEVGRLEELRTAAHEDLVDAELVLGAGPELVTGLERLVSEHPFRERLRGQLMLALYRGGRQAEALDVYRETRQSLVDELGIEPGTALRQLEQAILRQDESLTVSPVRPKHITTEERRKTVTVLIADLASTGLDDVELLVAATAPALAELRTTLEAHGATIEQRAGDEVMAVFGVPTSHEDDALRAARAASQLQRDIRMLGDELEQKVRARIEVRVGIETGEVLAGTDAAGHGFVAGPAIALAKRLQQAARPGDVLVGQTVRRLLGAAIEVEPVGAEESGDGRMLRIVEGVPPMPRHLEAPLVGREGELAMLKAAFDDVAGRRRSRLFVVAGEAGIGKTRLASELISVVGESSTVLVGRCISYGEDVTYRPLREIVRAAAGTVDFSTLLADDEDGEAITRNLVALAGNQVLGPSEEALWAARRLFEALAREQPLTLVVEDLQWAEPAVVELIELVVRRAADLPILVVGTARPELLGEQLKRVGAEALELSLLHRSAAEQLIDNLGGLPRTLRDRIVGIGEGNPLFLEQLAAHVAEDRRLQVVPPSLEALLMSRLDRLPPGELAVLQRAAVAGREFPRGAVLQLMPADDALAIDGHLEELLRKGMIHPGESEHAGAAYRFHHVLIRDVAYGTLPKGRRAELHERLARWLEATPAASDELVGFHLEQASRYLADISTEPREAGRLAAEAGARLGTAGLRAWRGADVAATVRLLGRAVELLPPRDRGRLELLCELGLALRTAGEFARAEAVLEAATAEAATNGERRVELRARMELANSMLSGQSDESSGLLELVSSAIPTFEALRDDRSLGRAWLLFGYVQGGLRCRNADWQEAAERALVHYRKSGWPTAACIGEIATALYYGPTPALDGIRHCQALFGEVAERAGEAHLSLWHGGLHAFRGDLDYGRDLVDRARTIYDELGYQMAIASGCGAVLGEMELLAGDPEAAERCLRASCRQLEAMDEHAFLASRAAELAEAIYRQDRFDEAERWTDLADAHAARDDVGARLLLRAVRAKILARRGSLADAEALIRDAVVLAGQTDALNYQAKVLSDQSEVLKSVGKIAPAKTCLEAALDLLERKGNLVGAERVRILLAGVSSRRRTKTKGPVTGPSYRGS